MRRIFFTLFLTALFPAISLAQNMHVYVGQNGERLTQLGTDSVWLGKGDGCDVPVLTFVNCKAALVVNDSVKATLPLSHGSSLHAVYGDADTEVELNKVERATLSPSAPFATIYSPFRLVVPSGCEVYVPQLDKATNVFLLNDSTRLAPGTIVPPETAMVIYGESPVSFAITNDIPTCKLVSALYGSSQKIPAPTQNAVYTFSHDKDDASKFGFFRYVGEFLNPGFAYFVSDKFSMSSVNYLPLSLQHGVTGVADVLDNGCSAVNGKFMRNGRIIIVKDSKVYLLNGMNAKP